MPPTPSAKRSKHRQQQQKQQIHSTTLQVGDVVAARDHNYRSWPAVVIDSHQIPTYVKDERPLAGTHLCVRFMPDGQYGWVTPKSVRALTKEAAEKWLKNHVKKEGRHAAFEIAKDPGSWVEEILEMTRNEMESMEMPTEAASSTGKRSKTPLKREEFGVACAVEPKQQAVTIDLTQDSEDSMDGMAESGCRADINPNPIEKHQIGTGPDFVTSPVEPIMGMPHDKENEMPSYYSWISPEIDAAANGTPSSPRIVPVAREIPEELMLNAAFLEYRATLMRAIEQFECAEQKLNSIMGKVGHLIAVGKLESLHLGDYLGTERSDINRLEERNREIKEERKRLEDATALGSAGVESRPSQRPRSTHESSNTSFAPIRGHNSTYSF